MKYSLSGPTASHALVDFGDEGTAVVRFSRIVEGSISDRRCRVNWDNGEEYDGDLIITGKTGFINPKELQQYNSPAILLLDRQTITVTGH